MHECLGIPITSSVTNPTNNLFLLKKVLHRVLEGFFSVYKIGRTICAKCQNCDTEVGEKTYIYLPRSMFPSNLRRYYFNDITLSSIKTIIYIHYIICKMLFTQRNMSKLKKMYGKLSEAETTRINVH